LCRSERGAAFTDDYLDIEVVRFGDKLKVVKEIAEDTLHIVVPRMLLQPLIENSIKHGLEPRISGGTVTLRSRIDGGRLMVEVEDDGVGMAPERERRFAGEWAGEAGDGDRDAQCSRADGGALWGHLAEVEINSRPGRGTKVTLLMPILDAGAEAWDALVVLLVEGDDAGGAEVVLRGAAGGVGHGFEACGVVEERDGAGGHAVDVADFEEQAVDAVVDELGDAADAGGDGGNAAGHGFERGEAEGLHLGGHEHEVGEGRSSLTLSCLPRKWTRSAMPWRRARYSAAERSGPSPMSSRRAGMAGRCGRRLRRRRVTRLTGRKLER
jgi:anti-sigma regulatory factor (Ser/Thr protein kinase)